MSYSETVLVMFLVAFALFAGLGMGGCVENLKHNSFLQTHRCEVINNDD